MNSSNRGSGRRRGSRRLMGEINVTPFVDVMLVLLVIFMVTAPMMNTGVKVELPETSHGEMDMESEALVIHLDRDEQVFVNQYQLAPEELKRELPVILDISSVREVYLKADKSLSYGFVMYVMSQIREAGIVNIGMVTEPASLSVRDVPNRFRNEEKTQ